MKKANLTAKGGFALLQLRKRPLAQALAGDWPYWVGGVALAAANTTLMMISGKPWGITSLLTNAGSRLTLLFGGAPQEWVYYQEPVRAQALSRFAWGEQILWLNLGIVTGVFLAGWLAREWQVRPTRSLRAALLALVGGLLLGYGSRLALGCNAGSLLGGIPSLSLHGWLFAVFTLAGVALGMKLFRRFL